MVEASLEHGRRLPVVLRRPRTTIASARRRSLVLPCCQIRTAATAVTTATARPSDEQPQVAASGPGQALHFLYFCPDPDQHGSLRPIRHRRGEALADAAGGSRVTRHLAGPRMGSDGSRPSAPSGRRRGAGREGCAVRGWPRRALPDPSEPFVPFVCARSTRPCRWSWPRRRPAVPAAGPQRHRLRLAPDGHPEDRRATRRWMSRSAPRIAGTPRGGTVQRVLLGVAPRPMPRRMSSAR
jgi:hypothetical protein